jgi:hypothetical protein
VWVWCVIWWVIRDCLEVSIHAVLSCLWFPARAVEEGVEWVGGVVVVGVYESGLEVLEIRGRGSCGVMIVK